MQVGGLKTGTSYVFEYGGKLHFGQFNGFHPHEDEALFNSTYYDQFSMKHIKETYSENVAACDLIKGDKINYLAQYGEVVRSPQLSIGGTEIVLKPIGGEGKTETVHIPDGRLVERIRLA